MFLFRLKFEPRQNNYSNWGQTGLIMLIYTFKLGKLAAHQFKWDLNKQTSPLGGGVQVKTFAEIVTPLNSDWAPLLFYNLTKHHTLNG